MDRSILGNGNKVDGMEKVNGGLKMGRYMLGTGKMAKLQDRES